MEPGSPWLYLLLVFLLMMSAFFSASETALISINKIKLRNLVENNVKNADIVAKLVENPEKLLSTLLVGNNLVNIGASSIATSIAVYFSPNAGVGIATVVMTIVVLIFGEITPKTLASSNPEKLSFGVIKIVNFFVTIFSPIVAVLNVITGMLIKLLGGDKNANAPTITESELKTMVNVSHEEGIIHIDERKMINNVFDFGDCRVKDVMTPRTDMVAISVDTSFEEITEIFKEERFSRLPVYGESIDDIIGILHLKDIAFCHPETFNIREVMHEPYYTYESKGISELFGEMREKRVHLVIILDEYGGTSGLATMEDLVEEIVGEIEDEDDEVEDEVKLVKEDEYIIDGSTRLDDLNELIGTKFKSEDFDTIGGYVIGMLGRFPENGEMLEENGIKITVEETEKNRIEKLRIYT